MDAEKTGMLIRTVRSERNMTQKELAEQLHVSAAAVSKWENGHGFPDLSSLEKLADVLQLSITDLIQGERMKNDVDTEESVVKDILQLSEKERKEKDKVQKMLITSGIGVLFIVGSIFITYMTSTQNKPVLDFTQSTGILTIAPLLFGMGSWIIALINCIKGQNMETGKSEMLLVLSFACCAIALWFPVLQMDLRVREEDVVFVLDTVWGFNFASMFLLWTTVLLNSIAYKRNRFSEREYKKKNKI